MKVVDVLTEISNAAPDVFREGTLQIPTKAMNRSNLRQCKSDPSAASLKQTWYQPMHGFSLFSKKIALVLGLCLMISNMARSQGNYMLDRLSELPGVTVTEIGNPQFPAGYFILSIPQLVNHEDSASGTFSHRVFLGIRAVDAPNVLVMDGYGVDYAAKPDYQHELGKLFQANLIVVEHRFFSKSQIPNADYRWLTTTQAAADVHHVRELIATILTGKWISTGTSKGGQAALAHRMHYPEDVAATVVFGTAVKKTPTIATADLLQPLMEKGCGAQVAAFQKYGFEHKDSIFPAFIASAMAQKLDFGDMEMAIVLDYALLEFPYSFWQTGGDCVDIPSPNATAAQYVDFLNAIVSPKFYTVLTRKRWAPAFYQFYTELGYYEYNLEPFKEYLSAEAYPNSFFAPKGVETKFDTGFLERARDFLEAPAGHTVFFVYGENDPWALQSVVLANKYVVEGGSHKSKLSDLSGEQRAGLESRIRKCLAKRPGVE